MAIICKKKLIIEDSTNTQVNNYIVVHNSDGKTLTEQYNEFVKNKTNGKKECTHYILDDKTIYQTLKDNFAGTHTNGDGPYKWWNSRIKKGQVTNKNSIAIMVSDATSVDLNKSTENLIELIRYLMKNYNIPIENVLRHGDTANIKCPLTIVNNNKWDYIIAQIIDRNNKQIAISIDFSNFDIATDIKSEETSSASSNENTSNSNGNGQVIQLVFNDITVQESLSNANTSDNWIDMHKIKGITLHFYPPYHNCDVKGMPDYFKYYNWDRSFHYKVDCNTEIDFNKKPVSGKTRGGNNVGTSRPDVELIPGEGLYSGVIIGEGGNNSSSGTGEAINSDVLQRIFALTWEYEMKSVSDSPGVIEADIGDGAGKNYGAPSFTEKYDLQNYRDWLKKVHPELESKLSGKTASSEFDKSWKALGDGSDRNAFLDSQIEYLMTKMMTGIESIKSKANVDINQGQHSEGVYAILMAMYNQRPAWITDYWCTYLKSKPNATSEELITHVCDQVSNNYNGIYRDPIRKRYKESKPRAIKMTNKFSYSVNSNGAIVTKSSEGDGNNISSNSVFGWPLPKINKISSPFGWRTINGRRNNHKGIDIPAEKGTKIHSYAAGKVVNSEFHSSYGNYVKIDHGNGCYTLYAHQSERKVNVGDTITSGQVIGLVGNTGHSFGNHLHFELRINNERVDPALYVKPGGGSKKIPESFKRNTASASLFRTMDREEPQIIYDNIDKGTICFASEENNQHTYIERALFNNQHQKYTLSIGEFFDNQEGAIEKDQDYDYPKTEKKLIEQCAKALYDEGFTSEQLWREFDLNRAPSPFLYLDREKWILFCKEVDKQVEWLNTKYGKVTATYVPNNLLKNENTNEFIEMSPDLGVNPNGGTAVVGNTGTTGTTVDSLEGGTIIGDSRTVMLKSSGYLNNIDVHASSGKIASYFYKKDGNVNRLKDIQQNTKYILVWLGINNPDAITATTDMLSYLKQNFTCPIYIAKEFYVTKGCTDPYIPNASAFNKKVDSYNTSIQNFCNKNGINFIDYTGKFTDGSYGKKDYYLPDGIHLNDKGQKLCIQEIATILTGKSAENTVTTTSFNNFSYSNTLANIEKNNKELFTIRDVQDTQADPDNVGKYCYVICDTAAYIYKKADTSTDKIKTCAYGDELEIKGAQDIFYKVTFDNKTGYIRAKNVSIIMIDKFGKTDKNNIGKECWTRFDNTEVYNKDETFNKVLDEQTKGKIIDLKEGYYYVEFEKNNIEGWVKAYRITTDYSSFDYELNDTIEEPYQKIDIEVPNGDFEEGTINPDADKPPAGEGNAGNADNKPTGSGGTESSSSESGDSEENNEDKVTTKAKDEDNSDKITGWSELGQLDFLMIDNPTWREEGHWNYRGNRFARIHNISKGTAGIINNINIPDANDGNFQIRISAWIKQVTQNDYADAIEVDAVETLMQYDIVYALLDKNNKIKHSEKIEIPKDHTKFGQRSCVFSNVKAGDYKLFIGSNNNNKFDIFIDNVTVEQIYDYNESVEDSKPSGNIAISGVGNTSVDNGGIMAYNIGDPSNPLALQPEIKTIITQEEYEQIMINADNKLIQIYTNQFEPYDKGLEEILEAPVIEDDRLNTLTEKIESFTGNDIFYSVVETGPGSIDHCVKPADELNVLYKQIGVKCDPIYPDLIIPPNYSSSEYDSRSENSIPLQALEEGTLEDKDLLNKKISYDYSILKDKEKKSKGSPINYNDAYPYDDKINELEQHYPKVSIDEIESRLYSCNHPGCPIAHPMAKNFAMINDMQLAQSKKIEQRLARIENILSWTIRNLGRTASRMNINCVYYGGQDIFGKYKTIRCTHDDRIHDGLSVTLDQCLCCTRYEPIIGQIYDILDETGFNGSAMLDDMQMSYMTLDDLKNLNKVERRSTSYKYAKVNEDSSDKIPKELINKWKERDKDKYKEQLKKKYLSEEELEKELKNTKESDYIFTMDWTEKEIDGQEPDIKKYPTEGIVSKYYKNNGDKGESIITNINLNEELNKDVLEDINKYNSIVNGEWVDTREEADTTQSNKYTSEDFYFENFNKNRTGYVFDSGFAGNIGLTTTGSISRNLTGSECRNKIVEKAKEIVQLHKDGKASYSNNSNTKDDTKRLTIKKGDVTAYKGTAGMIGYDCSSMASCCYKYAGLNSLYAKSCSGGTIMDEIVNNGGEMWLADEKGLKKAMPGDCIVCCGASHDNKNKPTESEVKARKKLTIYHIMIYLGNNQVAHASGPYPVPKSIRIDDYGPNHYSWGYTVFIRPKDLIESDKMSEKNNGQGIEEISGTIDGNNYVCVLRGCKNTRYNAYEGSLNGIAADGTKLNTSASNALASHNMPYGTKIYIPALKGKGNNPSAIYTVHDTGNAGFDFDICCPKSVYDGNGEGSQRMDMYVLSWGNGAIAPSHSYMMTVADISRTLWNDYKNGTMATANLTKFTNKFSSKFAKYTDLNIKSSGFYDLTSPNIYNIIK